MKEIIEVRPTEDSILALFRRKNVVEREYPFVFQADQLQERHREMPKYTIDRTRQK